MINFINSGKDLSDFSARLRSRKVSPATISVQYGWPLSSCSPFISDQFRPGWKKMSLEIELKGTWAQIEEQKGALVHELASGKLSFTDEPERVYLYVMDGDPGLSDQYDGQFETLTVNLLTAKEDAFELDPLDLVPGETKTVRFSQVLLPLRTVFEVTGTGEATLTLNGKSIVMSQLTGVPRIIGEGRVMEGTANMWEHTQLPDGEFLELVPGENTISIIGASLRIRMKRRYL